MLSPGRPKPMILLAFIGPARALSPIRQGSPRGVCIMSRGLIHRQALAAAGAVRRVPLPPLKRDAPRRRSQAVPVNQLRID